ncbi:hypothetical protein T11_10492 [Trichinella zimbabwensis]|uniref:Uncharacterized protein n=1 Tax=Trichinella zimbabwensis TaxID=268475 RepID=A0A0V1GZ91_9BILA|nr:hypothetical protein T11_10492 [Trichinella zimbabwensis]
MIRHRYGDRYLHNEALEIGFRKLEVSEDLLLIGHFIFDFIFTIDLQIVTSNLLNAMSYGIEKSMFFNTEFALR